MASLIDSFDACASSAVPHWVDLEAPSGWGKTRIVQEFFNELSARRQGDVPYWPTTLGNAAAEASSVLDDRKVIRPLVTHLPGSLPTFMWWGISCSRARGHHSTALANDLRQFVAHVPYLEDALTVRRGRGVSLLTGTRRAARDLVDVGAEEAASLVLETVLSAAIPGLGFARPLAKAVRGSVVDRRERRRRLDGSELIVEDGDELVLGAVSLVQRLSGPGGLPCVIVIEDLHLADRELAALLEAIVALDSAQVLVITTSWPGFVLEQPYVSAATATAADMNRFTKVGAAGPNPGDLSMPALGHEELAALVHAVFPGTEDVIVEQLLGGAESPLALMLTLDLPRFARFKGGPLNVAPEDVPSGPATFGDIIRATWQEMPQSAQFSIGIAALSTPGAAPLDRSSARPLAALGLAHLDEWEIDLLADALADSGLAPAPLVDPGRAADRYAWAMALSPSLRRFRDPLHFDVATERVDEHLLSDERAAYRRSLASMAMARWGGDLTSPERELLAHLIVGLAATGSVVDGRILAAGGLVVVQPLQLEPTSWRDAVAMCDEIVGIIGDSTLSAPLEIWRWRLSAEMGDTGAAKRNLRRLVRDVERSDDVLLLAEARHHLAVALANSGDARSALETGEAAYDARRVNLGPSAEPTLRSQMNLAWFASMLGEHIVAERELRDAAERSAFTLGPAHPVTIAASIGWAAATAAAGDRSLAVERLEAVRRTALAQIDPASPIALILEYNLLVARSPILPSNEAKVALADLMERARRTFGDSHPFIDELDESLHETSQEWDFFVQLMGVRSLG